MGGGDNKSKGEMLCHDTVHASDTMEVYSHLGHLKRTFVPH